MTFVSIKKSTAYKVEGIILISKGLIPQLLLKADQQGHSGMRGLQEQVQK